jgi:hypothetical protein
MKNSEHPKPPSAEAKFSERFLRRKHRKDTSTFLWGTGLMLFLGISLGADMWQGFRSGQWVDIGAKMVSLPVPWWLAATLALIALVIGLWCFVNYLKLKSTAPKYEPGDEDADVQ